MTQILIICGPTATGKTALAAKLAKKFNGELISADSRQVYQGMDIVTGKDRPAGVIIHGLDLVKPSEEFSAAHFVIYARNLINQINNRGKLSIIVGGTGQYIDSLLNPPETLMVKPNWILRKKLERKTVLQLQEQVQKLNLARFKQMNYSDKNNPRRLIRAIEVASSLQGQTLKTYSYEILWLGLTMEKTVLNKRIAARVQARIAAGAMSEWQKLKKLYSPKLISMSGIGYRELPDISAWVRAEQQYARRQLTWFKKNSSIHWNPANVVKLVKTWYTEN